MPENINWEPHPTSPGVFLRSMLSGSENMGLKNSIVKIIPGGQILKHTHDVTEAIFFLKGQFNTLVNGNWQTLAEGNMVAAPAGVEHSIKNDTDQDIFLLATFES